ncbi:hypothetical protein PJ311_18495 [Bacillus sp. CLL-7-23]|uniref:Uncharacterized protein n=1 Tax=Bacillus changyiensis TaxID=3004103 RepID=A0ABT4X8B0_9BACI|nr:hypothetical protein [Bacillus changyiensis]MDA1477260.1 hypothetical protein [Bacillus changyiensis]MDA7028532.1 hypothetical protein [Bacillus changyiensis]
MFKILEPENIKAGESQETIYEKLTRQNITLQKAMVSQVLNDGNAVPVYELFCDCWENGTITTIQLKKALSNGLITQSDYDKITASPRGNAISDETEQL